MAFWFCLFNINLKPVKLSMENSNKKIRIHKNGSSLWIICLFLGMFSLHCFYLDSHFALHCILFETKLSYLRHAVVPTTGFCYFLVFPPYILCVCLSVCSSSSPRKWQHQGGNFPPLFPVNNRRPQIATPLRPSFMHGISFSPSASPLRSLTLCHGLLGPYP